MNARQTLAAKGLLLYCVLMTVLAVMFGFQWQAWQAMYQPSVECVLTSTSLTDTSSLVVLPRVFLLPRDEWPEWLQALVEGDPLGHRRITK